MKLFESIDAYVEQKHSSGLLYEKGEARLRMLARSIGNIDLRELSAKHLSLYFGRFPARSSESTAKYLQIRRFLEYWHLRGMLAIPVLPAKPQRVAQTFVPYIYTTKEIRAILAATASSQLNGSCLIDGDSFKMILILLYATGANPGEIVRLRRCDVDVRRRCIRIEHRIAARSRCIPIGKSLLSALKGFVQYRFKRAASNERLFTDRHGRDIQSPLLTYNFRRLCKVAQVIRRDGLAGEPRLLDLKATFAVNRITAWIKEDADLNRMLPALAAYLGQAGLGATATYLRLTPERFKRPLKILSPRTAGKHWRDDKRCLAEWAAI